MEPFNPLTSPLDGQRLIEASAGTGKTYSIAFLYLRFIIERGLEADEILVVTFTSAATEELRNRIRIRLREIIDLLERPGSGGNEDAMLAELVSSLQNPEGARLRLQDALTRMDEAAIYTIHSFCQRMLQEHAFESGMPFEVDFIESEELLRSRIMEDFWRQRFYQASVEETEWALATWQGPDKLAGNLQVLLTKPHAETVPEVSVQQVKEALDKGASLWVEVRESWSRNGEEIEDILRTDPCLSRSKDNYGDVPLRTALVGMNALTAPDRMVWALPDKVELFAASVMAARLKGKKVGPEHAFFALFDRFLSEHGAGMRLARIQTLTEAHRYLCDELERRKQQQAQMYYNDLLTRLDSALVGSRGVQLKQRIRSCFKVALVDEFQDTDPVQYRIFHALFGRGNDPGLFMIGDPKQSIYSFRGADIFAYIQAGRDTPTGSSFTMETNYRATTSMVAAVNRLFDRNGSFVFTGEIDFHPVRPCPGADDKPLLIRGKAPRPLQVQLLTVEADATPGQKSISKQRAGDGAAAWTASEIARLLTMGQRGEARIGDEPLSGGDLAILVRTHVEAEQMQHELRRLNIASVYYSRDSVYEAPEAGQVYQVLAALLDPADEAQVRNALVTGLFGLDAATLDAVQSDTVAWSTLLAELEEYRFLWRTAGLTAMFHRLLFKRDVVHRFVGMTGGERTLTNFLHLVELLQEASSRYKGDDLVCWFKQQLDSPEKSASNQQLRLESDKNLVKIVTIHKAKGLEYSVVFLPFLWSARVTKPDELFACHLQENKTFRLVVDLGSGDERNYVQAEQERLAEDLRLLYVALTRARYCCYFTWGRISSMEQSALSWLLHRGEGGSMVSAAECTEEKIEENLTELNRYRDLVHFVPRPSADEDAPVVTEPLPHLSVRSFTGHIDTSWAITSYSRLSAPQAGIPHTVQSVSFSADEPKEDRGLSVFTFPKGAVAGNCLHGFLESFDFTRFTADELQELALDRLKKSGFDSKWVPILVRWMEDIVATPLDTSFILRLEQIPREDRKVEMGFYFGMHDFDPGRFNEILADFSILPLAMAPERLRGLMKGYIDLIFRSGEQYYILDYKSNYLGPDFSFYTPDRLQESMQEHRYDLQYLIYTVALHRYLKGRLDHYAYNHHVGGVFYLFLRGLHPDRGPDSGVWYTLPPIELIEQLDQCFGTGVQ